MSNTYKSSGVDIQKADQTKKELGVILDTHKTSRVKNSLGAFASLLDVVDFKYMDHPILVLKMEEPGSKQLLSIAEDRVEDLGLDLINHLMNDLICMGATPLAVLDTIVCGSLDQSIVTRLVGSMAKACADHGCSLVGGETSEQPGVLDDGKYVLSASAVGVVEAEFVIDGSCIEQGDKIIALPSNGLHTNGYSLVRKMLNPNTCPRSTIGKFHEAGLLNPHTAYYPTLGPLLEDPTLHGLAHITGGGIQDNLKRILPPGTQAMIDLSLIKIPEIFNLIRTFYPTYISDSEMLKTFNLGVGMIAIINDMSRQLLDDLLKAGGYPIGRICRGDHQDVGFVNTLCWS